MTAATSRLRRRGIGAGVAALVGLTGLGLAAVPAQAAPGFDPSASDSRVAGADRFATAAIAATAAFPDGADTAILANGWRNIDALSGGFLAGQAEAPILLADTNEVPQATLDALDELGVTNVWILGDETSVGAGALEDLQAAGITVTEQLAGDDRYDTAAQVFAEQTAAPDTVFIARADYPNNGVAADALAAGPLAYNGSPILLTEANNLPDATAAALEDSGVQNIVFLGRGIAQSVQDEVADIVPDASTEVLGGIDRSETAQLIAEAGLEAGDYDDVAVGIANGDKPDALAAGPWSAITKTPILLTLGTNALGAGTEKYLAEHADTLAGAYVFGDEKSITPTQTGAAADVVEENETPAPTTNQTLAVSPNSAVSLDTVAGLEDPNVTTDDRAYTVTELTDGTQYRVTLVNSNNVTVDANGVVSFAVDRTAVPVTSTNPDGANGQQTSGSYLAAAGTVSASFRSVNGSAPTNNTGPGTATAAVTNSAVATPVNGSITFTVDGNLPESVIPVVYINGGTGLALAAGGASPRLEVNAQGLPQEAFGLGGAIKYTAPPATAGNVASTPVVSVDKAAKTIVLGTGAAARTYAYDNTDTFSIAGSSTPTDLASFEAALNRGDVVSISPYTPNGQSVFAITTNGPTLAVSAAAGSAAASNDITVTIVPSNSGTLSEYTSFAIERQVYGSGTWTPVGTVTPAQDASPSTAGLQYVDNDVAAGTYLYRASAVVDGVTSTQYTTANTVTSVTPTATSDVTAPLAIDTILTTNVPVAGNLDAGDVFKVVFDEPLAALATGDTLRLADSDVAPTVADLVNGTNATFALNTGAETVNLVSRPAGTVLTVTLTGNPNASVLGGAAGTTAGIQLAGGVDIIGQSGLADVVGNAWDVTAANQDVTIETVGGDTNNNSNDSTGPTFTAGPAVVGATTVTFTASEPLDVNTVSAADFTRVGGASTTISNATVGADGRTITVMLADPLAATNTVTLTGSGIKDANGQDGTGTVVATA